MKRQILFKEVNEEIEFLEEEKNHSVFKVCIDSGTWEKFALATLLLQQN